MAVQTARRSAADTGGKSLYQIAPGLWGLDSFFVAMGSRGSLRMSIVQTPNGLILYSPVALTAANIDEIAAIGRVKAIIAPNLYHHFHLRACIATYPDAEIHVPQGLIEKIGPVDNARVFGPETDLDAGEDVEHFTFSGHYVRETVLYHRPSRSLITADLLYHYTRDQFRAERIWFWLIGCYGLPKVAFYHRFAIRSRASVADLIRTVSNWDVQRVVMSHGRVYEGADAGRVFTEAWRRIAKA